MNKCVSIVKETSCGEYRVIALPTHVKQFVEAGYEVLAECGLGEGIRLGDKLYAQAGATLVSREDAWGLSPLVLKYKPPCREEFRWLHKGMNLGAIFRAEGNPELVDVLLENEVTAYAYEYFQTREGTFPLAMPGGEIAGKMAVIYGAYHLQRHRGGSGVLLSSVVGARLPRVLIIGYGNVGGAAARLSLALGAEVVVLGRNEEGLRRFRASVGPSVRTEICTKEVLARELPMTDLVIGAILISTYTTPPLIDDTLIKLMKPGSMVIDVTCGHGSGYLPSFDRPTDLPDPVYEKYGVLHCKIDRFPAAVPVTTAEAYATAATPYLIKLADALCSGIPDPVSDAGKITDGGCITHTVLQEHVLHHSRRHEDDGLHTRNLLVEG